MDPRKDDLTVRYEEVLRLREELERRLANTKQSRPRKKAPGRKTPTRSRDWVAGGSHFSEQQHAQYRLALSLSYRTTGEFSSS